MTRLLLLLPLLLAACGGEPPAPQPLDGAAPGAAPAEAPGAETVDAEPFIEACLATNNWERPMCVCAEEAARLRLSRDGYAFLVASMQGDDAETERLRTEMPMDETVAAGMFFVNAGADCAEQLGQGNG